MASFRELYNEYLKDSNEHLIKQAVLKITNCDIDFKNRDELIFLYRQARIYNIESKLDISNISNAYKQKREKVKLFLSSIRFDELDEKQQRFFTYNSSYNQFDPDGFLRFCAIKAVVLKSDIEDFVNEMLLLSDSYSISKFAFYYVSASKMENSDVPELIKVAYESCLGNDFNKEYSNYISNHFINGDHNTINKYRFIFPNVNYLDECFLNKSKSFLVLADEMKDLLSFSSLADYSCVSLQYYKIIEVELKDKIIKKVCETINNGTLYLGSKYWEAKPERAKKYDFSFLPLGDISQFFEDALCYLTTGRCKKDNSVNRQAYKALKDICSGDLRFIEFFVDITDQRMINRYRNPPAHTEPLQEECVDEVETIFWNFVHNINCIHHHFTKGFLRFNIINKILNGNY